MVIIYCNKCFESKAETHQKFVITSCYHIFCEGCAKAAMAKNFCIVCKTACKMLPINEQLPTEVKNYFDERSIGRLVENIEKISKFIDTQNKAYSRKNAPYRTTYYNYKKSILDMREYQKKLDETLAREKAIIDRLKHAYNTKFIPVDLFKLRSSPLDDAQDDPMNGGEATTSFTKAGTSSGFFDDDETLRKSQMGKKKPTQPDRHGY